jgi:hypothetical protein
VYRCPDWDEIEKLHIGIPLSSNKLMPESTAVNSAVPEPFQLLQAPLEGTAAEQNNLRFAPIDPTTWIGTPGVNGYLPFPMAVKLSA